MPDTLGIYSIIESLMAGHLADVLNTSYCVVFVGLLTNQ